MSDATRGGRGSQWVNGRPPHPATAAQPRAPHPATVAQPKPAFGGMAPRPPHAATVAREQGAAGVGAVQPMISDGKKEREVKKKKPKKEDKHEKANIKGASGVLKASGGENQLTLQQLKGQEARKKFSDTEIIQTILIVAYVNDLNARMDAAQPAPDDGYGLYICELFNEFKHLLELREPHVGRGDPQSPSEWLQNDLGDMDVHVASNTPTFAQAAWHVYARDTPSAGYKKKFRQERPHTPQWAEFGTKGVMCRVVYDWWNDLFYVTPHYNEIPEKGLINPYVELHNAALWTLQDATL